MDIHHAGAKSQTTNATEPAKAAADRTELGDGCVQFSSGHRHVARRVRRKQGALDARQALAQSLATPGADHGRNGHEFPDGNDPRIRRLHCRLQ